MARKDNHTLRERNKMLLFYYYQAMKECRELSIAIKPSKGDLASIAAEKVYLSPSFGSRLINSLQKNDKKLCVEVENMLNEGNR